MGDQYPLSLPSPLFLLPSPSHRPTPPLSISHLMQLSWKRCNLPTQQRVQAEPGRQTHSGAFGASPCCNICWTDFGVGRLNKWMSYDILNLRYAYDNTNRTLGEILYAEADRTITKITWPQLTFGSRFLRSLTYTELDKWSLNSNWIL